MFNLFFSPVILDIDNQTQSNNHKYRHTKASCTNAFAALLLGKDCMIDPKRTVKL